MILGIGIDSVEIARFALWSDKPYDSLRRIFCPTEIAYCLQVPSKSSERFAARFAAREAFFKALTPILEKPIPFLSVCRCCCILHDERGAPALHVNRDFLMPYLSWDKTAFKVHISITHTKTIATAYVIIER